MSDLYSKKVELRDKNSQLNEKLEEKEAYLEEADKIKKIYNQLKEDKDLVIKYRKSVRNIKNESFDTFKGNLYRETYKPEIAELIESYSTVIDNIDENMDRLNTMRAKYENKAYKCDGVIGYLRSAINSLTHEVQNWVN